MGLWNPETGEILDEVVIINDLEDIQKQKDILDKRKSNEEFKVFIDENLGNFYFLFYKLIDKGIQRQYIVRFLYLCTYIDYNNNLLYGNAKDDNKYMLDKDLQEVLRLSRSESTRTIKSLIKNELIYINENNIIHINKKYCLKGKIEGAKNKSKKVRIFENGIKELYEKSKPTEHKKLALLIELLPYINFGNNIICENPECEIHSEIKPLDLKTICEIIKYSPNQSSRLKKDLLSLRVNGELVTIFNETDLGKFIAINPKVYYKGCAKDYEKLKWLVNSFEIKGGK